MKPMVSQAGCAEEAAGSSVGTALAVEREAAPRGWEGWLRAGGSRRAGVRKIKAGPVCWRERDLRGWLRNVSEKDGCQDGPE